MCAVCRKRRRRGRSIRKRRRAAREDILPALLLSSLFSFSSFFLHFCGIFFVVVDVEIAITAQKKGEERRTEEKREGKRKREKEERKKSNQNDKRRAANPLFLFLFPSSALLFSASPALHLCRYATSTPLSFRHRPLFRGDLCFRVRSISGVCGRRFRRIWLCFLRDAQDCKPRPCITYRPHWSSHSPPAVGRRRCRILTPTQSQTLHERANVST